MIKDSREEELLTKQEGGASHTKHRTSTRLWSALRNPRIVRVSKAFGGKDRHSKVSTIRGLRDRRVRLSVPTAIQLYDLQDKLGLNQPSKVVDWLLNAAQHEIDKLPPLPRAPGDFIELINPQAWASSSSIDASNGKSINNGQAFSGDAGFSNNVVEDVAAFHRSAYWASEKGNTAKGHHLMDDAMACTAFHQFEPPHSYAHVSHVANTPSQVELAQGFLLASASPSLISLMPGSQLMTAPFSSHANSHSHLQIPSTFAQLLPLNSSKALLPSGRQHEREQ